MARIELESALDQLGVAYLADLAAIAVYETTTAGLSAVAEGGYFQVPETIDGVAYLAMYRKVSGAASLVLRYPSAEALTSLGIGYQPHEVNGLSFVVVDEAGRRTWLEADLAGKPTARAAQLLGEKLTPEATPALVTAAADAALAETGLGEFDSALNELAFSITDAQGRRTELEVGLDGKFSERVITSIASRLGSVNPDFPVDAWACWGDSLTAGGWPALLATLLGKEVYNGGWGGQGYSQIAARQGGVPARVTVSGDTIPASGSVTVTAILNTPLSDGGNRTGYLAGVFGTLAMSSGISTFTRAVDGAAVECPPGSYFTPYLGAQYRDRHVTIWTGRNSFKTFPPSLIVASVAAMIDYLSARVKRVIVMSIPPWVGEPYGSSVREDLDAANAALAAAFPEYWLDISAYLRTADAAAAAGITFTSDDLADIALGYTPRSLRSDDGHMNSYGNTAIAARVRLEIQNRGWM